MSSGEDTKKISAELPKEVRWFGANQRRLRQDAGETLRSFSKIAGISYSFASSVEQGKTDFSFCYAAKIADLLGVSLEEMLHEPEKKHKIFLPATRKNEAALRLETNIAESKRDVR